MTFKEDVDAQIRKIGKDNENLKEKKWAYIQRTDNDVSLNERLIEMLQELRGVVPMRNPELFDEIESIEEDTEGHLEDLPAPPQQEPKTQLPEDEILESMLPEEDEETEEFNDQEEQVEEAEQEAGTEKEMPF